MSERNETKLIRKTPVILERAYIEHLLDTELSLLNALKGPTYRNMRRAVRLRIRELQNSLTCYTDIILVRIGFQRCFDYMRSAAVRIGGHKYLIDLGIGDQSEHLQRIAFHTRNAKAIAAALKENTSVPKYVEKVSFDTTKNPLEGVCFDES